MKDIEYKKYLEDILGHDLEYFDYKENRSVWSSYHADAQAIVTNSTFLNEINHYRRILMEEATFKVEDFDKLMHVRTAIVTLETLLERLKSIEDPRVEITKENINDAI